MFSIPAQCWGWIWSGRALEGCARECKQRGWAEAGAGAELSQGAEVSILWSHLFPARPRRRRTGPGSRRLRVPQFCDSCGEGPALSRTPPLRQPAPGMGLQNWVLATPGKSLFQPFFWWRELVLNSSTAPQCQSRDPTQVGFSLIPEHRKPPALWALNAHWKRPTSAGSQPAKPVRGLHLSSGSDWKMQHQQELLECARPATPRQQRACLDSRQTGKLRHGSAKQREEVAKTQRNPCHHPTM